jgi:hypothetical protein
MQAIHPLTGEIIEWNYEDELAEARAEARAEAAR